ncbi:MAG: TfuA-like protein [Candidatus Nanopelagicales bacterium]
MPGRHTYVFVGPTLPADEVRRLVPGAAVLPPIAAGDLWSVPVRAGDVVVVLDGYFREQRAVRHKELVALLDAGVTVVGAASMGALRAAELADVGMRGSGQVFAWYRDGVIEGDDEVAVVHGDAVHEYPVHTRALVDVRAGLDRARGRGLVEDTVAAAVIAALVPMPFVERDDETLRRRVAAGVGPPGKAALDLALGTCSVDIKRADAVALLRAVAAEDLPSPPPPHPDPFVRDADPRRSAVYLSWRTAEAPAATASPLSESDVLACARILARDYPAFHERVALRAAAADTRALGLPPPAGAGRAAALRQLLSARGLLPHPDADPSELTGDWLGEVERSRLTEEGALVAYLRRTHTASWQAGDAVHALRREGAYDRWLAVAERVSAFNDRIAEQRPSFDHDRIPVDAMRSACAQRWGLDAPTAGHEWLLALADRGYDGEARWLRDARVVHPYLALRASRHSDTDRV